MDATSSSPRRTEARLTRWTTARMVPSPRNPQILVEPLDDLEVLLALVRLVQDVEVLARETDAPEAVGAVRAGAAAHEIGAPGAELAFDAVRRGVTALAARALIALRALRAARAIVAPVAVRAVLRKHAE